MRLTLKTVPNEWQDEERVNSLIAPFRKKEVNPIAYESKMLFWKKTIETCCFECGCCTFTLNDLECVFRNKGRTPLCLKEVLNDLLQNGEINYLSEFEARLPTPDTWTSWAVKALIKAPVTWSFTKLKDSIVTPAEPRFDQRFVHLPVVKRKAEILLSNLTDDLKDTLISFDQLSEICKKCFTMEEELKVVVHWLELQGLAATTIIDDKRLVKFVKTGNEFESITETDKAIFSLQDNEKILLKSLEALETQKQDSVQEAKDYLKKGMRQMAKSSLRRKKELERQMDKRADALYNIQVLLSRLRDTESDSKVFASYKISLSAIKNEFKEAGISEDSVSNTMAQVQEILDIHDEIQTALGEPASTITTSTDEDFEKELADLLASKEPEPSKSEFDLDLPEAPSTTPQISPLKPPEKEPQRVLSF